MNAPHTPCDTRVALQPLPVTECNRSLYFERFARPETGDKERHTFFNDGLKAKTIPVKRDAWQMFLLTNLGLKPADLLFGRLQARLMVNMAGGVMENAGLCLDRLTGIPYIPGSAVKGCARRLALAALREWSETGIKPTGNDDLFTKACQAFDAPADLLAAIACVFGWADQDWSLKKKDGRFVSDIAWACGSDPANIWMPAAKHLCADFGWKIPEKLAEKPWDALPNYAGRVNFLPAYPVDLGKTGKIEGLALPVPELGKLELDVVTVHHKRYYAGPEHPNDPASLRQWQQDWGTAPDTEEPVPVVFPAVAPGHVFAFAVLPGRRCDDGLLAAAKEWLRQGLETFGLGAKVAAGYGWFDASEQFNLATRETLAKAQAAEQEKLRQQQEAAEQAARAEAERQKRDADKKALAAMTPDQQEDYKVAELSNDQFDTKLQKFTTLPEAEAAAVVRALRGPRSAAWTKLKERGKKGQWAQVLQVVYAANKKLNLGKLP